jgi:AAA+ ATPase superfamily predicted ATPase
VAVTSARGLPTRPRSRPPPGEPPPRNPYFQDREVELEALRRRLASERRVDLSGLSGVGKSQLALEYLHRHRHAYPDGCFWLRGEREDMLRGDLAALAWLLELEERTQPSRNG